jgi:hypothetical protein
VLTRPPRRRRRDTGSSHPAAKRDIGPGTTEPPMVQAQRGAR